MRHNETQDQAKREEQKFLLQSLRDLEREYLAGDVDEIDYQTLKSGYIARAADITRAIETTDAPEPEVVPRRVLQSIFTVALILAVALGAGWWVAAQSGQRLPGQNITGGTPESISAMLSQARAVNLSDPVQAIQLYSGVLKIEPDNVEALTYRSWLLALSANSASNSLRDTAMATAIQDLTTATTTDPTYPDAWCFLGIVEFRFLDNAVLAQSPLEKCQAQNPPHEVASYVKAIVQQVNEAVATKK
ncbi:MAG: hypothetical protein EXQ63_01695 [Ilumatobacteraceae bacterium]|nr:hypothetical protein [Ilumatobacteraceae bacterium]